MGVGGISQVAREAGSRERRSAREYKNWRRSYQPGERIRKGGGGRKKSTDKDADAASRFGGDAGAEGRSAEPGQVDHQVG